jgi:hypothetical protein
VTRDRSRQRYARVYDDLDDHPKALVVGNAGVGLLARALAYSARHLTDGFVPAEWMAMRAKPSLRRLVVDAGLFEQVTGGYLVHDYLDHNESRERIEEVAAARRSAGSRGGRASKSEASAQANGKQTLEQTGSGCRATRDPAKTETKTENDNTTVDPSRIDLASERLKRGAVQQVFNAWDEARSEVRGVPTGKVVLDDKRRRLIGRAVKQHGLPDVLDAVRGWRHSPHHRGENDRHTIYDDLGLLLRDADHVERFRDLERGNGEPARRAPSVADIAASFNSRSSA